MGEIGFTRALRRLRDCQTVFRTTMPATGWPRSYAVITACNAVGKTAAVEDNANTGEAYWDYVRRLAAEAGVDPEDVTAVRRFDKQRPGRKTSNQEWVNPSDPDAKVGKAKDGATDMLYKPENVTDMDSVP